MMMSATVLFSNDRPSIASIIPVRTDVHPETPPSVATLKPFDLYGRVNLGTRVDRWPGRRAQRT